MTAQRKRTQEIQNFIIQNVEKNPRNITSLASEEFSISRQAVHKHINHLIDDGILTAEGATRNRQYALAIINEFEIQYPLEQTAEDKVWRKDIRPYLSDVPSNVMQIFEYGVTEIINNAIDHSEGSTVTIRFCRTAMWATISIGDNGAGIFNKIQKKLDLDDPRHAVLELSKGKLTTDPAHHTGEGIFFTSRMFDVFSISSGRLDLSHIADPNSVKGIDFLLEDQETDFPGTLVRLKLSLDSSQRIEKVFDYYTTTDGYGFDKTIVPVFLAAYGDENLISRSQAKRLLARFDKFKEIVLDFEKVDKIGQAFADEIFRVFTNSHPEISLYPINRSEQIQNMIQRARNANIE